MITYLQWFAHDSWPAFPHPSQNAYRQCLYATCSLIQKFSDLLWCANTHIFAKRLYRNILLLQLFSIVSIPLILASKLTILYKVCINIRRLSLIRYILPYFIILNSTLLEIVSFWSPYVWNNCISFANRANFFPIKIHLTEYLSIFLQI